MHLLLAHLSSELHVHPEAATILIVAFAVVALSVAFRRT